jgi:hypothetical protein
MTTASEAKDKPRYQLTERAYINDVLHDPESRPMDDETGERKPLIITFEGIPGPHMKPVNKAAEEMVKKHPIIMADPVLALKI